MKLAARIVLPLFVLLASALSATCMSEFRGLYVDAFHPGIKTHEQVTQMVSAAKAANFNALIVQVRKRGDAYYNSTIEPKASDIATDYDPLADVIQQAHAVGLEVHAWLTVYEVSNKLYSDTAEHVRRIHPEWLMLDRIGQSVLARGAVCLDPGVPHVQDRIVAVIAEVAARYAVDGIHLDKMVYPGTSCGYNSISVACFREQSGRAGIPSDDDAEWAQWRCDQITDVVRRLHEAIAATKPRVKLSVAVTSETPRLAKTYYLQEWDAWMRDGIVDFVVPMLYFDKDWMREYAGNAVQSAYNRAIYIGVGAFRLSSSMMRKHVEDVRAVGVSGVVLYSYHYMLHGDAPSGYVQLADLAQVFGDAVAIPDMPWKEQERSGSE